MADVAHQTRLGSAVADDMEGTGAVNDVHRRCVLYLDTELTAGLTSLSGPLRSLSNPLLHDRCSGLRPCRRALQQAVPLEAARCGGASHPSPHRQQQKRDEAADDRAGATT